jgi:hypothetical protein
MGSQERLGPGQAEQVLLYLDLGHYYPPYHERNILIIARQQIARRSGKIFFMKMDE